MRWITAGKIYIVMASLFFYSWWNIVYLPLIIFSLLFNYHLGKELSGLTQRFVKFSTKSIMIFGVSVNLVLLAYFKYYDFFIANLNKVAGAEFPLLNLALPLAISFYTFQQIAYLVDSYKKETKEYDFLNYAVFVTFFPQLIAGPIVHHSEMMSQFSDTKNKSMNYKNIALGLFIFFMGLFKKVAIADTFAVWASKGFDTSKVLNMIEGWVTSLSYTFQLYFDFSGYTDMAIGAALLFNIKLPTNFNSPYKAVNIQDFWRRWHITLSRFLKEYVYISLGGNRKGESRTYINLFATFVLGGIWHGAGWTFVFWGILHGLALVIHRLWQKIGFKINIILAWFVTFNFINIAWIFFRATNFESAIRVIRGMFLGDFIAPTQLNHYLELSTNWSKLYRHEPYLYLWMIAAFILVIFIPNSMQFMKKFKTNFFYMFLTVLFSGALFLLHRKSEFIYFNF
jgi:D-alanyl-lipoteichoic acid acyltransferase DltB (MBOAT superfamily)